MTAKIFKKPVAFLKAAFAKVDNARYSLAKTIDPELFDEIYPDKKDVKPLRIKKPGQSR